MKLFPKIAPSHVYLLALVGGTLLTNSHLPFADKSKAVLNEQVSVANSRVLTPLLEKWGVALEKKNPEVNNRSVALQASDAQ